ncbi:NFKB inhibitor interacting Ras like 1 [Oratosquilla oratoria]|uniref:NFKB inhibitor interacting Ras like 1 n=1 Tax=Oratosquilla oratoria TaxID=337810 RepID=UPI003F774767
MGRTSKVVIVGGRGVGKTSILERAIYSNLLLDKPYVPTIEDTYVGLIETERGTKEKLRFYDTAGLDARNRSLPPYYHCVADGYIIVFSVTDSLSYQLLTDIKKDIDKNKEKKDVPIVIMANKCDSASSKRVVDQGAMERWVSTERLRLWEVNVKDRSTLSEPFHFLASRLNPQPSKTSFPQLTMGRKSKD